MAKTFCDMCGAEMVEKARFFKATHKHIINLKEIYPDYENHFGSAVNIIKNTDNIICEDCAKSLVKWIGGAENG